VYIIRYLHGSSILSSSFNIIKLELAYLYIIVSVVIFFRLDFQKMVTRGDPTKKIVITEDVTPRIIITRDQNLNFTTIIINCILIIYIIIFLLRRQRVD